VPVGHRSRILAALVAVAAVVAVNQTSLRRAPSVLGTKVTRCTIGGERAVATGTRALRSERLTVDVAGGRVGAVLIPPVKVAPGSPSVRAPVPVSIELGVRSGGRGRLAVTTVVRNSSDCSVAVTAVTVSGRRGTDTAISSLVVFGGRERVFIAPGRHISGRAVLTAPRDGTWMVDASGSADIGASG
jgi:hypothetical protein